jgi:hypothetical protein
VADRDRERERERGMVCASAFREEEEEEFAYFIVQFEYFSFRSFFPLVVGNAIE